MPPITQTVPSATVVATCCRGVGSARRVRQALAGTTGLTGGGPAVVVVVPDRPNTSTPTTASDASSATTTPMAMSGRRRLRRSGDGGCGAGSGGGVDPGGPEPGPDPPGPPGRCPGWTTVCAEAPGWSKCPGPVSPERGPGEGQPVEPGLPTTTVAPSTPLSPESAVVAAVCDPGRCSVPGARLDVLDGFDEACGLEEGLAEVCGIDPAAPAPNVPAHGRSTSGRGLDVGRGERSANCATSGASVAFLSPGRRPTGRAISAMGIPASRCTPCSSRPNASAEA